MGYEIKLVVGRSWHSSREMKLGNWELGDDEPPFRMYARDADDNFIETGRTEIYFQVYGTLDLCKPGDAEFMKLDWKNKESNSVIWCYYQGDKEIKEDGHGDYAKPLPVADVLAALKKDYDHEGYRRFKWAIAFLEGFKDEPEAHVLFHGH